MGAVSGPREAAPVEAAVVGVVSLAEAFGRMIAASILHPRLPLQRGVDGVKFLLLAPVLLLELLDHILGLTQLLEKVWRDVASSRSRGRVLSK